MYSQYRPSDHQHRQNNKIESDKKSSRNLTSLQVPSPVPKGMLSMNSSTLQKGPEINKNMRLTDTDSTDITHYNLSYSSLQYLRSTQIEHLEVSVFKIYPCKISSPHSHKHCPFFHNNKDRKRPGTFYSAELCEFLEKNLPCPYGDDCQKAHNRVEQLYRPDNYKTKFCTFYPNNISGCEYGKFCSFAHSEEDITIELIHNLEYDDDFFIFYYKSVWCPFNLTQHDKALCVYAHNWQDFRRKPQVFQYQPIACSNWRTTDFITEYAEGCSESFNCNKCHGWKELEYHPILFRTKQCINQNCNKLDCSFYHTSQDKRQLTQYNQFRVFKLVPRNRIIKNTFKIRGLAGNTSQYQSQTLSNEGKKKPMYLSQQRTDERCNREFLNNNFGFHSDVDWLGIQTNQNNSINLDLDSKSDDKNDESKKPKIFSNLLCTIQERTDSDELREIMRKRSFSVSNKDDRRQSDDQVNENIRCVLNMIDLDS